MTSKEIDQVILITGGSRGIGAATAIAAAQHNYTVVINYAEREDAARRVVSQIENSGGRAHALQCDVSQETQVVDMFRKLDDTVGQIAALVNNAGILAPLSRVEHLDSVRIRRIFDVNVVGTFLCSREAVRRMSTNRGGNGGSIINISSGAARLGAANDYVDYAASKAAIDTFTIGLAKEVAGEGIRVNAVRPGFIDTDMHDSVGGSKRFEQIRHMIPLSRVGSAEEVAAGIIWLLSEKASYSTGTILDITGGR
ncbi:MAG: SDR family oxidoreductase [Acidiferrobacterales bacterium]|nr:SDR family oxidoreductase [Acidiferrobacterales bacterium]